MVADVPEKYVYPEPGFPFVLRRRRKSDETFHLAKEEPRNKPGIAVDRAEQRVEF
jgi:hypothetical protein